MVDSSNKIPNYFNDRIKAAKKLGLTELDLSVPWNKKDNDKLDHIPESVFELTQLEKLNLSNNSLSELPESLSNLANLTELNLSRNQLTNLPNSIGNFANLTWIDLSGNQLIKLPESIGNLANLTHLYIWRNQLTKLPESIGNLANLTHLYIWRNQLTKLPESIGNLANLTHLYIWRNQLTKLPESIGNLANLTEINLSGNQLIKLPKSIGNFANLTWIDLSGNQLTKLPESIGNFANLTWIDLSGNQLIKLPESISNFANLTEIDLSGNQLIKLPKSIDNLVNLTWIDLSGNQLIKLPKSIGNLANLTWIGLSGNLLKEPPLEIATKGVQAIKEYFQELRTKGEDYIYEAKLLIVGEGGAGKTTLAKKIQNLQYRLLENQPSTEGIDVIKWSFPLPNKEREFKVNIWDFGGQEIYHATHQFFLTKRSLYALVADTRKEDTDFYYWLNIVELLSDNSPLLIIKNEKQDRKKEINERALRGQFTNLKETLATNLKTNRGLEEIITNIQDYIKKLPHIGQTLPKTWVKVRQALEKDSRNYISLQEYLDICEANGFTRHEDKLQLSGYLHDLGVCLHFKDEEDSLLYRTIILKPEWGTDAVYKVLDNKQVINNQGHFTRNDLKNIWQEEKYASMRGELLELMKKFQLCYEIPDRRNTFIAPQLLSENQPEYEWNDSNNLILRYAYPDFMPKGIITRFIVITHKYIHSTNHNQCVWRSRVVLEKDDTLAEITENYGKREIMIRVLGDNKRDFLTIIANNIDEISDSYKRLNYQKLIPCNCEICKLSDNPHFYDFKVLKKFIRDKQLEIQCQQSYKMVGIGSLIGNVIIWQNQKLEEERLYNPRSSQQVNFYINQGEDFRDQRPIQNIKAETINVQGAAAFGLGDISGKVANTINQLPDFDNPNKNNLKQILIELHNTVLKEDLEKEEKEETLEQIQAIASSLNNSQDGAVKKTAKRAMKVLRGTAALSPSAAMVTICNQIPDLISKIF